MEKFYNKGKKDQPEKKKKKKKKLENFLGLVLKPFHAEFKGRGSFLKGRQLGRKEKKEGKEEKGKKERINGFIFNLMYEIEFLFNHELTE